MEQHNIDSFDELLKRSTEDVSWFTDAVLKFLDIRFYEPYTNVVDLSRGIAWPKWCVDAKMNIVHNCLDKYIGTEVEKRNALIWEGEDGTTRLMTYGELYREVNKAANGLRSIGLGCGDPIGIYMPMVPETVVALLAIAKIGGVILPLFSGFGVDAIVERLSDADTKALFTVDGAVRRGSIIPMKPVADEAAKRIPTLKHMIVLNLSDASIHIDSRHDHWWEELITNQPATASTEITDAESPLMIIYTSGTTGLAKGAVHTHCGFPVKSAQDMSFGTDLHKGETIWWNSDLGWMMGPWLIFGSLILGGTFLLYDGAPDYPGPGRMWEIVEKHKISILGVSPTLIRLLMTHGEDPVRPHDLSSLRYFGSTGEPWNPNPWMWLFETVGKKRIPIINYSGGTEISGGIVMGNPLLPLKACAFSGPCPGIAADVFDEDGKSIRNKVGELVIKSPWIGMTRGFWKNPKRYENTYWSRWENVWVHGDFAAIDSDGLWYILGRSDDIIKVAGKRFGPAEAESVLVSHPAVAEAATIGVPHEIKLNELVVFCVLVPGVEPSEELRKELKQSVAIAMGKPLTPKAVLFVSDLPKTRNAKVMRRMIRAAYLGEDPGDTSSLVNPDAVEEIRRAK
ncbi:MAG: AMP-dependent synthetase [Candidatus Thorarchaeota archaeon]|nr:AMP-dependent synthetase [Candidatus Thorarchaeota archaeon]